MGVGAGAGVCVDVSWPDPSSAPTRLAGASRRAMAPSAQETQRLQWRRMKQRYDLTASMLEEQQRRPCMRPLSRARPAGFAHAACVHCHADLELWVGLVDPHIDRASTAHRPQLLTPQFSSMPSGVAMTPHAMQAPRRFCRPRSPARAISLWVGCVRAPAKA